MGILDRIRPPLQTDEKLVEHASAQVGPDMKKMWDAEKSQEKRQLHWIEDANNLMLYYIDAIIDLHEALPVVDKIFDLGKKNKLKRTIEPIFRDIIEELEKNAVVKRIVANSDSDLFRHLLIFADFLKDAKFDSADIEQCSKLYTQHVLTPSKLYLRALVKTFANSIEELRDFAEAYNGILNAFENYGKAQGHGVDGIKKRFEDEIKSLKRQEIDRVRKRHENALRRLAVGY